VAQLGSKARRALPASHQFCKRFPAVNERMASLLPRVSRISDLRFTIYEFGHRSDFGFLKEEIVSEIRSPWKRRESHSPSPCPLPKGEGA